MKIDSENTNFNLRHLQAIHSVWQMGSFNRAADQLGVVPSALTETVRQIEQIVGADLFDRSVRPPVPTALGLEFLEQTRPLLDGLAGALRSARTKARNPVGALKVGAAPSTIPALVGPVVADMRDRYPQLDLTIHDDVAENLSRLVIEGTLDLAIAGRARTSPELEQRLLFSDNFGLVCHKDHPLAQATQIDLADIPPASMIHLGANTGTSQLLTSSPAIPGALKSGGVVCHSTFALLCMVKAGLGLSLLPEGAALTLEDPLIRFRPVQDLGLVRNIYLLLSNRQDHGPHVGTCVDLLVEHAAHLQKRVSGQVAP